ncbi:MAG: hypothetical protein QM523_04175 [Candidatus Pacebacteria bacterium]|nr:hypothetical protein [Candidatus Paceibacterota bacterium]
MEKVKGLDAYTRQAAAEAKSPTGRGAERINRQNRPTAEPLTANQKLQVAQRIDITANPSQGLITNKKA